MVLAELKNETFAIWDDIYTRQHDGVDYIGGAGVFHIAPLPSSGDMTIQGVDVTFSGLDQRVITGMEKAEYHQRPIFIRLVFLHPETSQLVAVHNWFDGIIDTATRTDQAGGTSVLTFHCESMSRELDRSGRRVRSDADQREIDPTDKFFQHTGAAIETPFYWGRSGPSRPFGN